MPQCLNYSKDGGSNDGVYWYEKSENISHLKMDGAMMEFIGITNEIFI